MAQRRLKNSLKRHREALGLSQQALAQRVGLTRQAILAIEAGRQVPSTLVSLHLAQTLGVRVEQLFSLPDAAALDIATPPDTTLHERARLSLGHVAGRWVGHPIAWDATRAADGVSLHPGAIRPLLPLVTLQNNVLVAGCAPLIGALGQRMGQRFSDASLRWVSASSRRALELLRLGLVHVAGLHVAGVQLADASAGRDNRAVVAEQLPGRDMLIVNLTRWRQGFVVSPNNPAGLHGAPDLLRPGLRLAHREPGAGAHKVVARLLHQAGAPNLPLSGPIAHSHAEVAQLVRYGAADVGVAIEGVALACGLGFVPLVEERFDLVVPAETAAVPPVSRLFDALSDLGFRADLSGLPGYDCGLMGDTRHVHSEAA